MAPASQTTGYSNTYVVVACCFLLPFVSKLVYKTDDKENRALCLPAICCNLNLKNDFLFFFFTN